MNETDKINNHLVDERYELVSLIFRLAEHTMFYEKKTRYQRKLDLTFGSLKNHNAVEYVKANLQTMSGDVIWMFAIHLSKVDNKFHAIDSMKHMIDFVFHIKSKFPEFVEIQNVPIWSEENTTAFLELVNDFYIDSKFARFFHENEKFYRKHSLRFIRYILDDIFFDWFKQFELESNNFRAVLSPTIYEVGAFGGWEFEENKSERIIYALLPCQISPFDYDVCKATVVHEFVHAFANPLADELYKENDIFRSWCDDTVDFERLPQYAAHGYAMACEYITRAYTILYFTENEKGDSSYLTISFAYEIKSGFPFIKEVYALITEKRTKTDMSNRNPTKQSGFHFWILKCSSIMTSAFITRVLIGWIAGLIIIFFFASNYVFFRLLVSLPTIFVVLGVIEYHRKKRRHR